MFRSSTILRELVQSLAKVIFLLKHSVKLCLVYFSLTNQNSIQEEIKSRLRSFGAESFVFQVAIQKLKDLNI